MKGWALFTAFCLIFLLSAPAFADEEGQTIYLLRDQDGKIITEYAGLPDKGDEYISADNTHYRVKEVDAATGQALCENLGKYDMPDVSWLEDIATPVAAMHKAVAMYCTHSDESYEKDDGTTSDEERGGIYDVADALKKALENKGVTVYLDESTHFPHDAGAYRRSRATAAELAKRQVDAILDIHRDGIPSESQYTTNVAGDDMTMVRLLVGRANSNADANKQFAAQIKAVADKVYPGLIKDIYIGKGTYNQDIMSHAVLLEFGTHTSDKDDVLTSTKYMADVLYRTLYGGVTGSAGASDVKYQNSAVADSENKAGGSGIAWLIVIAVVASLVYAFAASGRIKPALEKTKRTFQELGGGLFGRKKDE